MSSAVSPFTLANVRKGKKKRERRGHEFPSSSQKGGGKACICRNAFCCPRKGGKEGKGGSAPFLMIREKREEGQGLGESDRTTPFSSVYRGEKREEKEKTPSAHCPAVEEERKGKGFGGGHVIRMVPRKGKKKKRSWWRFRRRLEEGKMMKRRAKSNVTFTSPGKKEGKRLMSVGY